MNRGRRLLLAALLGVLGWWAVAPSAQAGVSAHIPAAHIPAAHIPAVSKVPKQVRDYYEDIALDCEFSCSGRVTKFRGPVTLVLKGTPTGEHIAAISETMDAWNALCPAHPMRLSTEPRGDTITVHVVPLAEMPNIISSYRPGNYGFYNAEIDGYRRTSGTVVLATELIGDDIRHFTREELTQVMGLDNDTTQYPDSTFYANPSRTVEYSDLDKALIKVHCSRRVRPGMNVPEVRAALAR